MRPIVSMYTDEVIFQIKAHHQKSLLDDLTDSERILVDRYIGVIESNPLFMEKLKTAICQTLNLEQDPLTAAIQNSKVLLEVVYVAKEKRAKVKIGKLLTPKDFIKQEFHVLIHTEAPNGSWSVWVSPIIKYEQTDEVQFDRDPRQYTKQSASSKKPLDYYHGKRRW